MSEVPEHYRNIGKRSDGAAQKNNHAQIAGSFPTTKRSVNTETFIERQQDGSDSKLAKFN